MFLTYAVLMAAGVLVLIIGLVAVIGLIVSVSNAAWLAARGTQTTGTVTRVEDRKPGLSARVWVAYETPGGTFTVQGASPRPWKGSPAPVLYSPARPAHATILTRPWQRAATALPVALLIGAAAAGTVVAGFWYFSGSHTSQQETLLVGSVSLGAATGCAAAAWRRYTTMLHWRRMPAADGKVRRYSDHSPVGPGILISFTTAAGEKAEFWVVAGTVLAKVGDTIDVRYSPDQPATTATVKKPEEVRSGAIVSTVGVAAFAALALYMYSML